MTRSSGVHSTHNPAAELSVERWQLSAALPTKAPKILIKDSLYISSPGLAWPQRSLQRRRAFQELFNRYYRQILYGCKNPNCKTPTCLSRQKRVSKAPFRPYTVLSARALATFLATQSYPDKGLCPHEPLKKPYDADGSLHRPRFETAQPVQGDDSDIGKGQHSTIQSGDAEPGASEQVTGSSLADCKANGQNGSLDDRHVDQKILKNGKAGEKGEKFRTKTRDPMRPTYLKVHRKHLSRDTLDVYGLPWELDYADSNYMIIKRWMEEDDQEILFEHTRKMREGKLGMHQKIKTLSLPMYIRAHHKYLSPETLDAYELPWEWDQYDSSYILINCWIPESDWEILFKHTRDLREGKLEESIADTEQKQKPEKRREEEIRKDPKSMTQNLFDTAAMRLLQLAKIPDSLLQWAPWLNRAEQDKTHEEVENEDLSIMHTRAETTDSTTKTKSNKSDSMVLDSPATGLKAAVTSTLHGLTETESDEPKQGCQYIKVRIPKSPAEVPSGTEFMNASISSEHHTFEDSYPSPDRAIDTRSLFASKSAAFRPIMPPQTLSHFTAQNIIALVNMVRDANPVLYEDCKFARSMGRTILQSCLAPHFNTFATSVESTIAYGPQSIIYVLSNTDALLQSFLVTSLKIRDTDAKKSCDFFDMRQAFQDLMEIDHHPSNIFPSLWISVGGIYVPALGRSKSPVLKPRRSVRTQEPEVSLHPHQDEVYILLDCEVVHIVKITLAALVAWVPACHVEIFPEVHWYRASGKVVPRNNTLPHHQRRIEKVLQVMDAFDDEMALSLMTRLVKAITSRLCNFEMSKFKVLSRKDENVKITDDSKSIMEQIVDSLVEEASVKEKTVSDVPSAYIIIEWLRNVMLKEWDGKAKIAQWGAVGGALEFLSILYRERHQLGLSYHVFYTAFISERLDVMEMPTEWHSSNIDRGSVHLLSYPFLFLPSTLVSYFRSINHAAMAKAFERSIATGRLLATLKFRDFETGRGEPQVPDTLRQSMNTFLVLEIRRKSVLTDALNQLWRRERDDLVKPLKVRMGMDEGEEGIDHGGVQQEFFRVAIREALQVDYGMFTTDLQTHMSWFQPCSLEPLYKFELLGLLTSLAVYNGLTIPVTFPLALYRKLLDLPITSLTHIEDGWPELAKGLRDLLAWTDGSVEEVFSRSYVFSVEGVGTTIYVDMDRVGRYSAWPSTQEVDHVTSPEGFPNSPDALVDDSDGAATLERSANNSKITEDNDSSHLRSGSTTSEACMVTDENSCQYVEDYIFWLTHKSVQPQYEAFAKGFYVCLDRRATSIFSPEALKSVVEGIQEINVDALRATARYDGGFSADHRVIRDFWHVVRHFSVERVRQLLEFVTASDRVPVNGVRSILFVIQQNGTDDERLPMSHTCFGRLLLPAYSSRKKLKERLCIAIEHNKGFGAQ